MAWLKVGQDATVLTTGEKFVSHLSFYFVFILSILFSSSLSLSLEGSLTCLKYC